MKINRGHCLAVNNVFQYNGDRLKDMFLFTTFDSSYYTALKVNISPQCRRVKSNLESAGHVAFPLLL
jgi:hypothetical protein